MKYIALVQSSVIVDAETLEGAAAEVNETLADARKRNCGDIGDEILASAIVTRVKIEESDEE